MDAYPTFRLSENLRLKSACRRYVRDMFTSGVGTSINQAVHLVFVPSISAIQHLSRWSLPRWVSPQEENVPQPLPGFLLLLENKRKFVSNPMQLC